jgi:hypothetical protein
MWSHLGVRMKGRRNRPPAASGEPGTRRGWQGHHHGLADRGRDPARLHAGPPPPIPTKPSAGLPGFTAGLLFETPMLLACGKLGLGSNIDECCHASPRRVCKIYFGPPLKSTRGLQGSISGRAVLFFLPTFHVWALFSQEMGHPNYYPQGNSGTEPQMESKQVLVLLIEPI